MASHQPSEIQTEIEIDQVATECPIQTSTAASRPVQTGRNRSYGSFLWALGKLFNLLVFGLTLCLPILVLLLVAFAALTMVQLVTHNVHYDKVSQIKAYTRLLMFIMFLLLATEVLFIGSICELVLDLKHILVLGLSIYNRLFLISSLAGITMMNFYVSLTLRLIPPIPLGYNESRFNVHEALLEIVDCVLFLWCVFMVIGKVAILKQHKILGLYSWKWLQVTVLVVIGYNIVRMFTHLTAWVIQKVVRENLDPATMKNSLYKLLLAKMMHIEYLVYYANGLKRSITFILCSLLTLLIWVLYFGPRLSKTPQVDKIMLFGTRTCLCVFICSVLWLLKTWVVLSWEASAMYARLRLRLLESKNQLYFLGIIGRHNHDILKLTYYGPIKREATGNLCMFYLHKYMSRYFEMMNPEFWDQSMSDKEELDDLGERQELENDEQLVKKLSTTKRKIAKYNLLMHNRTPNTHDIKQVAEYLIFAKTSLADQTFVTSILDRLTPNHDIRGKLEKLIDDNSDLNAAPSDLTPLPEVVQENLRSSTSPVHPITTDPVTDDDDWLYFKDMAGINEECSENMLRTWLEKAQANCLFLANAVSSTKEVVDVLNTIVSCVLIGATFIIWLLVTGLASTTVLVLIASPLFAATFIFGDTCKTLFQGVMYVYVVHPIHVGDLCSVDSNTLVVKSVGVWTTTFCKVEKLGTLEEVTYPNSELAVKVVINHLTEFVWDDSLEINLGSLHGSDNVKKLKKQIETHLDKREDEFVPCSHSVVVQVEGEDFKIVIKLRYKITNIHLWSYFKCERRREKLQADVDQLILQLNSVCKENDSQNPDLSSL